MVMGVASLPALISEAATEKICWWGSSMKCSDRRKSETR